MCQMSPCQYAGDWFPVGFFNFETNIVMNLQYLEKAPNGTITLLKVEINVKIEEAKFPDTSLRVSAANPGHRPNCDLQFQGKFVD